jgi:hypothetical protein
MKKMVMAVVGMSLMGGSAIHMTPASARHVRRPLAPASRQFRNAYNFTGGAVSAFCSREPGNPYNPANDYSGWSSWRQLGAWDSRNDCN